jgi:ABC-2 type transport system permease protein
LKNTGLSNCPRKIKSKLLININKMQGINISKEKRSPMETIGFFLERIGSGFEVVFILLIWFFIFSNTKVLGDFDVEDMVAYLLIGNLIGLFTSYLLRKTVRFNIGQGDLKMFYYKPFAYIIRVFSRTLKKIILPFFLSISLNLLLLYFFVNSLYLNSELKYLVLIIFMMILAFFTELLLAFIFDIYVFWSIESKMISRLKKILAGAYFPLSFLGTSFLTISLLMPFAYSFYVPTQLYLKNISFEQGLIGLSVQLLWIAILYFVIKISWQRKVQKSKDMLKRKSILE